MWKNNRPDDWSKIKPTAEEKGIAVTKEGLAYLSGFTRGVEDGADAMLGAIANWLEDLPTDGWDKWHFYHRELAGRLRREEEQIYTDPADIILKSLSDKR